MNTHDQTRLLARLREQMIRNIVACGHASSPAVRQALGAVPRHQFLPNLQPADAYDHQQATTSPSPSGPSSIRATAPLTIAMMLDQADVRAGHRVLHIGTGAGYTTAVLAELVGPTGTVITLDTARDVTTQARRTLNGLGYRHVTVITADGTHGAPEHGPYDRIIVTASAWDLPQAWSRQLATDGRLVVPLRFRGMTRSLPFDTDGDVLRASTSQPCTFLPLLGPHQTGEYSSAIGPGGRLTLTWEQDQTGHVRGHDLYSPEVTRAPCTSWSGVKIHDDEPLEMLQLFLAATERGTCRTSIDVPVPDVPRLAVPARNPAILANGSIAYLTHREIAGGLDGTRRYELGAAAYGAFAERTAEAFTERIRAWAPRRRAHPTITLYPPDQPTDQLPPRQHIRRPSVCVVVTS